MLRIFSSTLVPSWATGHAANQAPCRGHGGAVEAAGLTVVYERVPVLRDIDLAIAEGESIAVMGPNGAGKSTLLKCLVGAVRPAGGCVRWFGQARARRDRVCRQIGYVGQECGLYAELTAVENLLFSGRMHGVANVRSRAASFLAEAGLERHADRPAGQLSQGMRQRLAIARALMHEPLLLVLDEPASTLDATGRRWLEHLFHCWRHARQTVCFASHDAGQCRNLADRIVYLDAGRIVDIKIAESPFTPWRRSA